MVHKGVDFLRPKCSKTHLRASLIPSFARGCTRKPTLEDKGGRVVSWLVRWGMDAPATPAVCSHAELHHIAVCNDSFLNNHLNNQLRLTN